MSAEVTDVCFWVVIKNVKDHPNYPSGGLLVTELLISVRSIYLYGGNCGGHMLQMRTCGSSQLWGYNKGPYV